MRLTLRAFLLALSIAIALPARAQTTPVFDARSYGVVCDGSTDDTAAINKAIVAAGTRGTNGATVLLPPGTCIVSAGQSDAIVIKYDNIELAGAGQYATTLKNSASSRATVIHAYHGTYPGGVTITKNVVIRDLGVDGNQANITHNATDTYENGINLDWCQNCRVERTYVRNVVFQGIVFQGSGDGTSKNNIARGNVVTAFGEYGIGLEGGTDDSSIEGNVVYGGTTVPEVANGAAGILVSQISQTGRGNRVVNNLVDGMPNDCIRIQDGSTYTNVVGNTARNCGTGFATAGGITVNGQTTSPNHVNIEGNTLTSASGSGAGAIQILNTSTSVGFANVVGNKIADTSGGGVLVSSGKNTSILGNRITNCGTGAGVVTSGIRLAGSSAAPYVSGNDVDGCAGNGIEVLSGTTSALLKGNTSSGNTGAQYSDAGTGTIIDAVSVSYTPTWTGSVSNPTLGNGTITGTYVRVGNIVHANIRLSIGSTTTLGSGVWFFSLPITPAGTLPYYVGTAEMLHSGVSDYTGVARWDATNGIRIFTGAQPAATVGNATPFAWANLDEVEIQITYPVTGGT